MSSTSRLGVFLPLSAGLVLGSAGAWSLHQRLETSTRALRVTAQHDARNASSPPAPRFLLLPPRLSESEADAALDAYLALPPLPVDASAADIHARFTRLRALLTVLPASRFDRLFAALALRVGDPEARCRRIAFAIWTELDAPAAARWALAVVPGEAINSGARGNYLHLAARAWAETDFDAAYAWVSALSDTQLSRALAGPLLAHLAAADPARALALARARGEDFFNATRAELFDAWSEKDPAAAVRALGADLLAQKNSPRSVHQALVKWIGRDSAAAFAWIKARLEETPDSADSLIYSIGFEASRSPEHVGAFADLVVAHPELPDQPRHLRQLAFDWARKDPNSFFAWLKGRPSDESRANLVENTLGFLDSAHFLDALHLLPEGPDRDNRLAARLTDWARFDPDSALVWIAAHPSPEVAASSAKVEGAIISHLAFSDPAAALSRWQDMPDSAERRAAIGPIALSWAKTDPAASLRFLAEQAATLPPASDHELRNSLSRTAQNIASLLARQDPAALLRAADTLPAPALRSSVYFALANDHDVEAFGQISTPISHQTRADLLASIPDADARATPLNFLLHNWLRRDYEAARAWIETHDALPPEAAAKLLDTTSPDKTGLF